MALRLRRDVQKASYYVWFLGAEEAKGLRGDHVIHSVLPYLISRSRNMEPLKVTLQVSHKGIKIVQGSSKHLIPHSAITSSLQTEDIVACVLLLYNPATKCPLHVHGYRCDSESTAEALNQQLQILINRTENQKRFEELEARLGILPHVGPQKPVPHNINKAKYPPQVLRHHELSPKRFTSSLGSDTGHSTRESECSEEHSVHSPLSRSPPHLATKSHVPNASNNELFDSLAAELRAKLNGNGPPLLLPPRDYDTVHRSKGNLTAIELRRCRNSLIVGNTKTSGADASATTAQINTNANTKQVSSRGSSGIGSDLAPSPERQDLHTSSDEEQWSNEADSSVIALKPSQISLEHSAPIVPRHVAQIQRKITKALVPEDSYLRDLPAKPYNPRSSTGRDIDPIIPTVKSNKSASSWSKEDEIKPIIMRPADYDAKFNRLIQAEREQKQHDQNSREKKSAPREREHERSVTKLNSTDKYNEINRLLHKKLSLERQTPPLQILTSKSRHDMEEDSAESEPSTSEQIVKSNGYRNENMTDKQKFLEYTAKRNGVTKEIAHKYSSRQRYIDPVELTNDKSSLGPNKYAAVHRSTPTSIVSETHSVERHSRTPERAREKSNASFELEGHCGSRDKSYSHSHERNPYREPESLPYIESMEKMFKSSALRYKSSYEGLEEPSISSQEPKIVSTLERDRHELGKSRYIEAQQKFSSMEEKYKKPTHSSRRYNDWSDEERLEVDLSPPPSPVAHLPARSHSRSREQWERRDLHHAVPKQKNFAHDIRDYHGGHEGYRRYNNPDNEGIPRSRESKNHRPYKERDFSPNVDRTVTEERRNLEKQRLASKYSAEMYPSQTPHVRDGEGPSSMMSAKSLSNLNKGYRHSYAEPVFGRSAGRVGLAAVNPY